MISVIIPAYNDPVRLLTCINSLRATSQHELEYLVQDDASPGVLLPAVVPPCAALVERNPSNLGFAGNCNAGAKRAIGDILFFVNQDVYGVYEWSSDWDEALRTAFSDPSVGIVGARLLFPDQSVQSAGGTFDANRQPIHRCLGYRNPLHKLISEPREVDWVTGAALAIRRELWEALGGFDEAYRGGYFEDVDLCLRARALGAKVWYAPDCTLVHPAGTSGGNPRFMDNARLFKSRWVDSGMVEPGLQLATFKWW